jgi:hypothetical protein
MDYDSEDAKTYPIGTKFYHIPSLYPMVLFLPLHRTILFLCLPTLLLPILHATSSCLTLFLETPIPLVLRATARFSHIIKLSSRGVDLNFRIAFVNMLVSIDVCTTEQPLQKPKKPS